MATGHMIKKHAAKTNDGRYRYADDECPNGGDENFLDTGRRWQSDRPINHGHHDEHREQAQKPPMR